MARKIKTAPPDRQQTLAGFDEQSAPAGTPPAASHQPPATSPPATSHESPATPSLAGKTVYVVDAHSLIYQVFHALPEMTSPRVSR